MISSYFAPIHIKVFFPRFAINKTVVSITTTAVRPYALECVWFITDGRKACQKFGSPPRR